MNGPVLVSGRDGAPLPVEGTGRFPWGAEPWKG